MNLSNKIIGAVSYLNSVPLVHCFDQLRTRYRVQLDFPSRLADSLAQGLLECALIPTIEVLASGRYQIVSDACVGCQGPVGSVKVLSRRPIQDVRSIAFDEGSRTSIALSRILMKRYWHIDPTLNMLPLNADYQSAAEDAVMIIGDRAMSNSETFPWQYDLGEVWHDWTGMPFVFAVWAAQPEADLAFLDRELSLARDRGVHEIESIVRISAPRFRIPMSQCRHYLTRQLNYYLGEGERRAMLHFGELARELSLIPPESKLNFYDCQVT